MKLITKLLSFGLVLGTAGILSATPVCPSTPTTNSDCNFLITISNTGMASVSSIANSAAFNGPQTFVDGTMDPGNNGSLVGVVNNYSGALQSFTLTGSGANAGIFDFSFNGICVYTNAAYCATAPSGYEGPTTSFSNIQSTVLFQSTRAMVSFMPGLSMGSTTYFSIEDNVADITSHGGLTVSNLVLGPGAVTATPEPAAFALLGSGLGALLLARRKFCK